MACQCSKKICSPPSWAKGLFKICREFCVENLIGALGWKLALEQSVLGAFQAPIGPMRYRCPGHQNNEGADKGQKKKLRLRMASVRMSQPGLEFCLTKKRAWLQPVIVSHCVARVLSYKKKGLAPTSHRQPFCGQGSVLQKKGLAPSIILWPGFCLTKKRRPTKTLSLPPTMAPSLEVIEVILDGRMTSMTSSYIESVQAKYWEVSND